ncbi:MAG: Ku protein [Nitrospira sp. SG-bin1]|nr:MAG: Ku protein [Nitrospira sp. SG-bin1]
MPRTLWKGAISFGLVHIPVGLYSAEKRNSFDLTMLDRRDMKPVGFKRYNKETGEDVPWDQIVKGYEYEKGRYVVLTEEDFRRANVEATQTIDILRFVEENRIAPMYFETPYYLAPDRRGEKGYALLRETLRQTHKVGIANVVIRTRQYVAALIPMDDMIVMNTLRYANEVRAADELELPPKNVKAVGVTSRESEMAVKLVEEMTGDWKPEDYHDTYHEDLLKLIDKRIKAGETEVVSTEIPEVEEKPSRGDVVDLMALLKRSVQDKSKQRSASAHRRERRSDGFRRKTA